MRRVLWKRLPVGVHMEQLGGPNCPLDGRVEGHTHVLKNCFFSSFLFDNVRRAFGLAEWGDRKVEPSRMLLDEPLISLRTTQGLVLWAGLKAQWRV